MERPILAAMLSVTGTKLSDAEKKLFTKFNPLGITLFAKNIESKPQLQALTDEIRNVFNRDDVLIAVDQDKSNYRHPPLRKIQSVEIDGPPFA